VYGHIVSGLIQPTTIGKLSGVDNSGVKELKQILKAAGFPVSVNRDMDSWLINHLAMVCPLGNAIYADGGDNYTASKNNAVIKNTAMALKEAFRFIKKKGVGINPVSNYLFLYCPTSVISFFLRKIYSTKWANTVIANHSLNARNEMHMLSEGFIIQVRERGGTIPFFEKLASYNLGNYSPTG
jgi:2-dehydropantoate 2-reductase